MKSSNGTISYRDTIFLPKTDFPMKAKLPEREPEILARWERIDLWGKTKKMMLGREPFTLHDGPIYSNGKIHIGHALNRILKDVVMRAHRLAGKNVDYVPGWDTHGLPIEWKVEEEFRKSGRDKEAVGTISFRNECRRYSQKWMEIQSKEFQRLGVVGDWSGRYATMDFTSEASIANEIGKFLLNGLLYRGLRPVMWSPVEKTALAEAEIEYHDKTSDTVYVRLPMLNEGFDGISAVYWTTTPWTVPGTKGVSLGSDLSYTQILIDDVHEDCDVQRGDRLLVATALTETFCAEVGITAFTAERAYKGRELVGLRASHPLKDDPKAGDLYAVELPFIAADYITDDQGTGFVPCAPAHGEEDFAVGRENGLEPIDTVAPDGRLQDWTGSLAGVHVFKSGPPVQDLLRGLDTLVGHGKIRHSYPHSWRSKAPVIYRATPQWFIRLDGDQNLRGAAIAELEKTRFIPISGANRIGSMLADRPDWCVSRQRVWGVPIPVFVEKKTGQPLRDPDVLERIVAAFSQEGADAWFNSPPERFLAGDYDQNDFEQVFDIIDVWFESGSSHAFVLRDRGMPWPADLYLEGTDQHRGWFQSSLLEAVGTLGTAPFKAILTHGFVLDENGRKMSKSEGNVVAPQEVTDQLGADILRLWVMNSDVSEDLRIGPDILKQQTELYRRLRNSLRFLLGNLDGFTSREAVDFEDLPSLERWVLHRVSEFDRKFRHALLTHEWTGVYGELHNFCTTDLSAFYFDVRKDVLYCDSRMSLRRRSVRTVLDILHRHLTVWLAPVLCFTAEESWLLRFPSEMDSVHLQQLPEIQPFWHDETLAETWNEIRSVRKQATELLEEGRRSGKWKSSLATKVALEFPASDKKKFAEIDWAELLIVSEAEVQFSNTQEVLITVETAAGKKCERCWRSLREVKNSESGELCNRCEDVLQTQRDKSLNPRDG